ncbi:type III pantothenate kinase [Collinsella sp. CLA-JM-H32B]|uniref:type III pantothenate kinase n=1 Tax=Collinsella sp. CLA-JM-H32B TaxID=3136221 RepID=UPI0032BFD8F3
MLLAIDMGNTQTAMGLFDGDELVQSWRMPTDRSYTADEIHVRLMGFFKMYDLSLGAVDAIAFAGVVPQLSREWHAVANRIAADAIVIGPQTAAVTKLRAARPQAVGADRIANAVAAETFYGAPAIVVDFGTATNIDVIDEDGYYIGGAIAPGIRISMDALAARAAKLASVPLEAPEHAIGRDTEECIKVGAVMGAAAMTEGLVTRMKRELGREDATVIATGGLAGIVADSTDAFDVVDGQLTIKGICEIYRRMQEQG